MHKSLCLSIVAFFILNGLSAQKKNKPADMANQVRRYWFVMLTRGPHRDQDSATAAQLQAGHMANIRRLYQEGKLKVAGPFGDDGDWQGIFIFDCPTREEVMNILQTDPAIAAGRMLFEVKPWYTMPSGSFAPGKPK